MVIQNDGINSILFPINVIDDRYNYVLLSGSMDPAQVVLQNYFDMSYKGSFTGLVLMDNVLRAGDKKKRFLKFNVVDNMVKQGSKVVELQANDPIRIACNHFLGKLNGLLEYSLVDKSQFNYN